MIKIDSQYLLKPYNFQNGFPINEQCRISHISFQEYVNVVEDNDNPYVVAQIERAATCAKKAEEKSPENAAAPQNKYCSFYDATSLNKFFSQKGKLVDPISLEPCLKVHYFVIKKLRDGFSLIATCDKDVTPLVRAYVLSCAEQPNSMRIEAYKQLLQEFAKSKNYQEISDWLERACRKSPTHPLFQKLMRELQEVRRDSTKEPPFFDKVTQTLAPTFPIFCLPQPYLTKRYSDLITDTSLSLYNITNYLRGCSSLSDMMRLSGGLFEACMGAIKLISFTPITPDDELEKEAPSIIELASCCIAPISQIATLAMSASGVWGCAKLAAKIGHAAMGILAGYSLHRQYSIAFPKES